MKHLDEYRDAVVIGAVDRPNPDPPLVRVRTALGTTRLLDLPSGEQLPRICGPRGSVDPAGMSASTPRIP